MAVTAEQMVLRAGEIVAANDVHGASELIQADETMDRLHRKVGASGAVLEAAPFQLAVDYPQWKDQYATPAFQQYLSNSIDLEQLTAQLTDGWESIQ